MVDIQTISLSLAAACLLIAATYYIMILRNQQRTRQASLFMQLYDTYANRKVIQEFLEVLRWE
jgi:preprotein translocase subunit YajC